MDHAREHRRRAPDGQVADARPPPFFWPDPSRAVPSATMAAKKTSKAKKAVHATPVQIAKAIDANLNALLRKFRITGRTKVTDLTGSTL